MSFAPHQRRVVITGIGVVSPCGSTVDAFWKAVVAGQSSAARVTRFDPTGMPCTLAAEIKDFDALAYVDVARARRLDPAVLYAIGAAKQAVSDSALDLNSENRGRIGVVEGTSLAGMSKVIQAEHALANKGWRAVQPTQTVNTFAGCGSSEIAIDLDLQGHAMTISTSCSSGNDAIGYAARNIIDENADVVLAGGAEAPLFPLLYSVFTNAGVMTRSTDPKGAMRPFDRDHSGFVLGEGSVFLVMEELTHALERNARIYCEWRGYGQSCDAFSSVATEPSGQGVKRSIQKAFRQANLPVDGIDYVNAHGSATATNEKIETTVYKEIFGSRARLIPISATKPVTGHLMAATAAAEAAICALSIYHEVIPPTAHLEHPAEGCDLDYVPNQARRNRVRNALNVNLGFGSKSSAVILSRFTR